MRVLLVHNHYRSTSPSGEDRTVIAESLALAAAGDRVERFEAFSDDIESRSPVRRALVPAQVLWSNESRRSLINALRGYRPDVVHVHNTFPLLSPSVLYACRAEHVPIVATIHNYRLVCPTGDLFRDGAVCHDCVGRAPVPGVRHGCYRESAPATLPIAAGIVAHRRAWRTMVSAYIFISNAQREIVAADGFPASRLFVKPSLAPVFPTPPDKPEDMIIYAGRLTQAKGVDLLMAAWDRYRTVPGGGRLRLVVAGAGPMKDEVAAWAADRPSVDWAGMVSQSECAALLARSRAAVMPSRWEETFGLVVVEAMAAGVPPLAPAHGSFPELITDGVDGVLFEPGSVAALAATLADVEGRPEHYAALGRAGRCTFKQRFRPEVHVDALHRIYRFAIQDPA